MFKNTNNDYIGWLVLIGGVVLILEILFFDRGLIFSLLIAGGMIYLGRKKKGKSSGKMLFYAGIAIFAISVFNMMTFKFLLLAILLHFFIQFLNSKKHSNKISPEIKQPEEEIQQKEPLMKTKPLFENILVGQQKTPSGVYEWNDVNIQAGIGDTVIDLSYTVLPKGETVIFIRNLIGNVQILVPYEIEVSLQHSGIIGTTKVFGNHEAKIFNQSLQYRTPGYDKAEQKVKILTSLIVGNLEVNRI